jgi:hypothetical protein
LAASVAAKPTTTYILTPTTLATFHNRVLCISAHCRLMTNKSQKAGNQWQAAIAAKQEIMTLASPKNKAMHPSNTMLFNWQLKGHDSPLHFLRLNFEAPLKSRRALLHVSKPAPT